MAHQAPLNYIFYIAATPQNMWDGFVSPESNRILFMGAELQADFGPGGSMAWVGPGTDGKPVAYVHGKVLRFEPPRLLQYTFAMGQNDKIPRDCGTGAGNRSHQGDCDARRVGRGSPNLRCMRRRMAAHSFTPKDAD